MASDPDLARHRIAYYRSQQDRCSYTLQLIDTGQMRFHAATGDTPMRDVTDERREEVEQQIRMYAEAITLWERDLA